MTDMGTPGSSHENDGETPVQGILRLKCVEPALGIQLMPARSKAGFFLLESHLQALQQASAARTIPGLVPPVSRQLADWLSTENRMVYLARTDWGAFRWVDEIFDEVLASVSLDAENAWTVNRLRLPVVHYVLKEPGFFSDRRNFCRRFLDTLVVNLMSTRSAHAREVKFVIGGFVSRLLETFQGDIERFNSLCLEAQQWFAIQQQRSHQLHLRLQERVRRDIRAQKAEELVDGIVEACLSGQTLPDVLVKFLRGDWRDFMLVIARNEGQDSALWNRTRRMTEGMVQIAARSTTPEAREHYEQFLPPLIKGVHNSLDVIQADDLQRKRVSRSIELIFSAVLLGSVGKIVTVPEKTAAGADEPDTSPVLLPPLMAEDWVRIRSTGGHSQIFSVVIEGDACLPWVLSGQRDGQLVTRTTEELLRLEADGQMDIIGTWRPFEEIIENQIAAILARIPREELLAEQAPELFSSLPVATHVVTTASSDHPVVREHTRPPVSERDAPVFRAERTLPPLPADLIAQPILAERTQPPRGPIGTDGAPELSVGRRGFLSASELAEPAVASEASLPSAEAIRLAGETVDGLDVGARLTWYRAQRDEVALTLSVRVKATGRFILVNRAGARLLAPDREEFAMKIASGEIAVLDAGSGFDSALERIVKHMQKDSST
jgi:hypothetical protein